MADDEPITDFLKRRLREAGAARFDAIAAVTGVTPSFIRKFVYGSRDNPRVQTVQPLLDFFRAVDRGDTALPDPSTVEELAAVHSLRTADVAPMTAEGAHA